MTKKREESKPEKKKVWRIPWGFCSVMKDGKGGVSYKGGKKSILNSFFFFGYGKSLRFSLWVWKRSRGGKKVGRDFQE